jgi:uncharacterized membrane protein
MDSRLSLRGNDLEPVLVMFPFGLLAVAVLLDLFEILGGPRLIGTLAYCTVAAAVVSGALTALAVRIGQLNSGHRANARQSAIRLLLDGTVLIVFAVIFMVRMRTPERTAGPGLLFVELLGLAMAGIGSLASAVRPGTGRPRTTSQTVRLAQIIDDPAERSIG